MAEDAVEKVLEIKVRYDDAIRKIAEYRKQLDVLKQVEKTLKEDVEKGRINRDAYNIKLTETKIATQEYNDAIRVLNKEIQNNISFMAKGNEFKDEHMVGYFINIEDYNDSYSKIAVIFNANKYNVEVDLNEGEWNVLVDGEKADSEVQYKIEDSIVNVSARSALILIK